MALDALIVLLGFQLVGEILARALRLPLPGPVLGMLLLFGVLVVRGRMPASLERTTTQLLVYLPLLFVPAGTGVIVHLGLLRAEWPAVLLTLILSTLLTLVVTAYTLRWLGARVRR
jgi:holin-like protein